jgi:hypothetical protein
MIGVPSATDKIPGRDILFPHPAQWISVGELSVIAVSIFPTSVAVKDNFLWTYLVALY